jgi:ATP-binding cassette, subfamily B, bacterial HlyB/CyaB
MPASMTDIPIRPPAPETVPDTVPDTGLVSLVLILRFLGIAASPDGLKHEYGRGGRPMEPHELLRCAKGLGVKSRLVRTKWDRLARTPLPAIARRRDGGFFVLAQVAADKVLIQDPLESRPLAIDRDKFEQAWSGELILLTRRAALTDDNRKFGIGWFVPAIVRYRALFTEVLVASFFLQLFALISPLFFQVVIDKVLVHRGLTTLDVLVLGLVVVSVFETVLGTLRTYVFSHTTNRIDVTLGARLFRHLLALPLSYFQARRAGDSIARVRELETVRNFLTGSALTLVIDLAFTVVFLAVMYFYSPVLTWIVLATIPCYVALSVVVTPILRSRLDEKFARGAENQAFLVEAVGGVETLKAMAVEPEMHRRWEEQLAGYVAAGFKVSNLGSAAGQVAQLINKLGTAATLYFGAILVIDGDLSVGQLVAFNMLAGRVSSPVLRLAQLWQDFQQARLSIARLGDILNTAPEPSYNPNRAALPPIKGALRFDHVTFRYRVDGSPALTDVSIEVPPGQVVGIVGPSGSGKSTLTKLLQRLYVPEAGRVLIDGTDLALVDPAWLRRQVGVVLQENVLFNRTIRDNIALADPGMPMERIIEAAKLAGAHEFILELTHGYDTMVGERGSTLSGGQRQRIAIARALVTQPRILIFDEATSALDYESESAIQRNMRRICAGRTVVIIAHRLAAVRGADRILTIEAGRLTEDGTHADLLRRGGRYAALHRLQNGEAANVVAG